MIIVNVFHYCSSIIEDPISLKWSVDESKMLRSEASASKPIGESWFLISPFSMLILYGDCYSECRSFGQVKSFVILFGLLENIWFTSQKAICLIVHFISVWVNHIAINWLVNILVSFCLILYLKSLYIYAKEWVKYSPYSKNKINRETISTFNLNNFSHD